MLDCAYNGTDFMINNGELPHVISQQLWLAKMVDYCNELDFSLGIHQV